MRAQYTMSSAAVAAIAFRAEALGLRAGMLVEHVMMEWLSKNEAIVLKLDTRLYAEVMKGPLFEALPSTSAASMPQSAALAPTSKKPCLVDTQNFRVPLGDVCGQEVKLEDIDENGYHRTCPGHWNPST